MKKIMLALALIFLCQACSNFSCPPHETIKQCMKAAEEEYLLCTRAAAREGPHRIPAWKKKCEKELDNHRRECRSSCKGK